MNKFTRLTMLALLAPGPLFAHHGTAGTYDETKVIKIQGVVKEFRWRNPHSSLFINAKDAAGNDVTYALEMGSPATLVKSGYTRTTFKTGDRIAAQMYPSFTHPTNGYSPTSLPIVVNGKPVNAAGAQAKE
jgi:hypothetical protein